MRIKNNELSKGLELSRGGPQISSYASVRSRTSVCFRQLGALPPDPHVATTVCCCSHLFVCST